MALIVEKGKEYKVKSYRDGTSANGTRWAFVVITDDKGKNPTQMWLEEGHHNINETTTVIKLSDFSSVNITKQEYPKGSGKWETKVSFNGVKANALVGDTQFGSKDFEEGDFGGELPF